MVLSVALTSSPGSGMKRDSPSWLAPAIGGLVLGLAAIALQCIEYTVQHFGPTDGAYASVFCAWTGFYLIAVLGTMYWLEIAGRHRVARASRTDAEQVGGDIEDPDQLIAARTRRRRLLLGFLGGDRGHRPTSSLYLL